MSNKLKQMAKAMTKDMPEQKTKSMTVRISINLAGFGERCTYVVITGIPEDLPIEYEATVIRTAESQFAQALKTATFMEFYNPGKTSKDEQPEFINLTMISWLRVIGIEKVNV